MGFGKDKSKKGVILEAQRDKKRAHFATLIDTCHLNAEWEPKLQKYKGRVVFRGDIVEDESGAYAVFTEHGSSASQMTAAKIMGVIARLPGCDGQAADDVSACTQIKNGGCSQIAQNSKVRIRLPRHIWPKSSSNIEDFVVPLERNLYGHPLAGLCWERQFEEVLLELGWEKVPNWECMFVHRKKRLISCQFMWMTSPWLERSRIWSYDMEGTCSHCVERYCESANKKVEATVQSLKSLFGWSSIQAGGTGISGRIIISMLTDCFEMLVLGTNWTTWHVVVSQQACEISHKMDSGMW